MTEEYNGYTHFTIQTEERIFGLWRKIIKNDGDLAIFDWVSSALRTRGSGIPGQAADGTREQPGRQRHGPSNGKDIFQDI